MTKLLLHCTVILVLSIGCTHSLIPKKGPFYSIEVRLDEAYQSNVQDVAVMFGNPPRAENRLRVGALNIGSAKTDHFFRRRIPNEFILSWRVEKGDYVVERTIPILQRCGPEFIGTMVFTIRRGDSVDLHFESEP